MTRPSEDVILTLVFATAALIAAVMSLHLSPVARQAPLVVAVATLALVILDLRSGFSQLRGRARGLGSGVVAAFGPVSTQGPRPTSSNPAPGSRERALLAWAAILFASSTVLGMLLGLPVFVLLYLRYQAGEHWALAASVAAGFGIGLFTVFDLLLQTHLYTGGLWSWLA